MTKEKISALTLLASSLFAVGIMGLIACADDGTKYGVCSEPTDFTSINAACMDLIKTAKTQSACESKIESDDSLQAVLSYRTCVFAGADTTATCTADKANFKTQCGRLPIGAKDAASAKKVCEVPIKINSGGIGTTAHCIFQPNAA